MPIAERVSTSSARFTPVERTAKTPIKRLDFMMAGYPPAVRSPQRKILRSWAVGPGWYEFDLWSIKKKSRSRAAELVILLILQRGDADVFLEDLGEVALAGKTKCAGGFGDLQGVGLERFARSLDAQF